MATLMQFVNKTRNPFRAPLAKGEISTLQHTAQPGGKGVISLEAHQAAMKANPAYRALVEQRKLIVDLPNDKEADVHQEELENTSDPVKPIDLEEAPAAAGAEGDIDATVESKGVELVEVPATGDAPAAAPASTADLTPAQKAARTRAANKAAKANQ